MSAKTNLTASTGQLCGTYCSLKDFLSSADNNSKTPRSKQTSMYQLAPRKSVNFLIFILNPDQNCVTEIPQPLSLNSLSPDSITCTADLHSAAETSHFKTVSRH